MFLVNCFFGNVPYRKKTRKKRNVIIKRALLGVFFVILLSLASLTYAYWQYATAEIVASINLTPVTKTVDFLIFEPEEEATDAAELTILPSETNTVSIRIEDNMDSTGETLVGEKAEGMVTFYNRNLNQITIDKGTVLTTKNLEFELEEEVKIASASTKENTDLSVTIKPGTTEAKIIAKEIGADYNLPKDQEFNVGSFNFSSVFGKSLEEITKGSSRTVPSVSEADQEELLETAFSQFGDRLQQHIRDNFSEQGVLILSEPVIGNTNYSSEIGDLVSSFAITLDLDQEIIVYDKSEIIKLAIEKAEGDIPENFIVKETDTEVDILDRDVNVKDGQISAQVTLQLFPSIDSDAIVTQLEGDSIDAANQTLQALPEYKEHTTLFTPELPFSIPFYPFQSENITLKLKPIKAK